jgi:phosphocarrier protein HPr
MCLLSKTVVIKSKVGVHPQSASVLVQTSSKFQSEVYLIYKEKKVNLKSIMGVMSLGIPDGAVITLEVSGEDEQEAIQSITTTIENLEQ